MTFGMAIYSAAGSLTYSSTDVTWNQVDMLYVPRGGDVWKDYPVLNGKEVLTAQMMIEPPPIDRKAIAHAITVSGTVVHIAGGSENTYVLILMR